MWRAFWAWYERTYTLNISIALGLFLLQIIHLLWLSSDVVFARLFGESFFTLSGWHEFLIVLVDYTEIPAIISVSLIYINELRRGWQWSSALYLLFLNSQLLHIFWITDEFVVESFTGTVVVGIPVWLAWIAILIDYLEVPVILDTLRRFFKALREGRAESLKAALRD